MYDACEYPHTTECNHSEHNNNICKELPGCGGTRYVCNLFSRWVVHHRGPWFTTTVVVCEKSERCMHQNALDCIV